MLTSRIPQVRLLTSLARRQSSLGVSRSLRRTCLARNLAVAQPPRRYFSSDDGSTSGSAKEEEVPKETLEFQAETRQVRKSRVNPSEAFIGESTPVLSHLCVETSCRYNGDSSSTLSRTVCTRTRKSFYENSYPTQVMPSKSFAIPKQQTQLKSSEPTCRLRFVSTWMKSQGKKNEAPNIEFQGCLLASEKCVA